MSITLQIEKKIPFPSLSIVFWNYTHVELKIRGAHESSPPEGSNGHPNLERFLRQFVLFRSIHYTHCV